MNYKMKTIIWITVIIYSIMTLGGLKYAWDTSILFFILSVIIVIWWTLFFVIDFKDNIRIEKERKKQQRLVKEDIKISREEESKIIEYCLQVSEQLLEYLEDTEYHYLIQYHKSDGEKLIEFYNDYFDDNNLLARYYLIIWASYQELWDLKIANEFFKKYSQLINFTDEQEQCSENSKDTKLMMLILELENLWIEYKVSSEEYNKLKNI